MALPTPGTTPANWGAQLNTEIGLVGGGGWARGSGFYTELFPNAQSTTGMTVGQMMCSPVYCPGQTIQSIACSISTGAATSVVRLGCWTQDTAGTFNLVFDFGTVDASTTGDKALTGSWALPQGALWFGAVAQVASCSIVTGGGISPAVRTHLSQVAAAGSVTGVRLDGLTGALPSSTSSSWVGTYTTRLMLRQA